MNLFLYWVIKQFNSRRHLYCIQFIVRLEEGTTTTNKDYLALTLFDKKKAKK